VRNDQDAVAAAATVAHEIHAGLLEDLLARVAGCFARRETRQTCRDMVQGLLMEVEDKNCWSLAEAAGHDTPDRMQHLLSRAVWDHEQALEAAADWAVEQLADDGRGEGADAVLVVDETADAKSSTDAAGAARQYSGTLGGVELCQVAVTLTFASGRGHALIGRALYVPEAQAADEEHRELAGIPEEVEFATKPELAAALLARACERGLAASFVAGDEVYGGRELRTAIRALHLGYVLAIRANYPVTTGAGRTRTAAEAARLIPARAWQRLRTGHGSKGGRDYDWAMLAITSDDTPDGHDDGHSWLLVRRHRYTRTLSYYRCWSPVPVPLARLIAVAVRRWAIEEDHQQAKQTCGLDAGQVIRWRSWHRWSALSLLAYLYLAVATAAQRQHDAAHPDLLQLRPISIPELLRQLRGPVIGEPRRDQAHRLAWSIWRRRHQYRAWQAHLRWHVYASSTT
jgi:SRSO17 transposase